VRISLPQSWQKREPGGFFCPQFAQKIFFPVIAAGSDIFSPQLPQNFTPLSFSKSHDGHFMAFSLRQWKYLCACYIYRMLWATWVARVFATGIPIWTLILLGWLIRSRALPFAIPFHALVILLAALLTAHLGSVRFGALENRLRLIEVLIPSVAK